MPTTTAQRSHAGITKSAPEPDYVHSLPGQIAWNGEYELESETILFRHKATWPSAVPFDGAVELAFHWALWKKEMYV